MRAIWKSGIIAESESTVVVEGNHYFPPESVVKKHLKPSQTTTVCPSPWPEQTDRSILRDQHPKHTP